MRENGLYGPAAVSNVFWQRKEQFQFACDTYAEWVLFAVAEGRFRYRIEDKQGEAGYGDIVFCPPGAAFHRETLSPLSFYFYRFRWVPLLPGERGEPSEPAGPRPVGGISVQDQARLSSAYALLQRGSGAGMSEGRRLALAQAVFQDLWQLICLEAESTREHGGRRDDPLMDEAEKWIRQHAFEALRLRDFSSSHRLSAVQFTRRFQAAWGQTPIEYTTALRIEKARALLLETRLPLDEVAGRCGYENGFYLSRVFTRKMNVTPSQFRKMNRL